jgi:hypothetical protein
MSSRQRTLLYHNKQTNRGSPLEIGGRCSQESITYTYNSLSMGTAELTATISKCSAQLKSKLFYQKCLVREDRSVLFNDLSNAIVQSLRLCGHVGVGVVTVRGGF